MAKRTTTALQNTILVPAGRSDLSTIKTALDFVSDAYTAALSTCSLLENIADNLPSPPHEHASQSLISVLQGERVKQIEKEEEKLFSFLEEKKDKDIFILNFIDRMRVERRSDEDLTTELVSALETILYMKSIRDPESFGYMLRGYFEAKRRQVGLKTTVMLPMVEQILKGDASYLPPTKL